MRSLSKYLIVASIHSFNNSNEDAEEKFVADSIPTAHFLDIQSIHQPNSPPFTIPSKGHFNNKMKEYGISTNDTAVFYSQQNTLGSYRMWYLLTSFGHPNCYMLDGNFNEWKSNNLETTTKNALHIDPIQLSNGFGYNREKWDMECQLFKVSFTQRKRRL